MGSSTLFPAEDKLREKADYHGWKMSIDLTLEDQGVLDHVRGNIVEPSILCVQNFTSSHLRTHQNANHTFQSLVFKGETRILKSELAT